jgi:hypothetical protein
LSDIDFRGPPTWWQRKPRLSGSRHERLLRDVRVQATPAWGASILSELLSRSPLGSSARWVPDGIPASLWTDDDHVPLRISRRWASSMRCAASPHTRRLPTAAVGCARQPVAPPRQLLNSYETPHRSHQAGWAAAAPIGSDLQRFSASRDRNPRRVPTN